MTFCKQHFISFVTTHTKMSEKTTFRYFLRMSFDGTAYNGWQIQNNAGSVQKETEHALSVLLQQDIAVMGAGRTDTGVHARIFYAHFDCTNTPESLRKMNLLYKLNRILPADIAIQELLPVKADAHARFDALHRTYTYIICNSKDPFYTGRAWMMERPLQIESMQNAANILTTYSDFSSFARSNTQTKTNLCDIMFARWEQQDHLLFFEIRANRFLRNMVRAIVGTLVDVGLQKLDEAGFRAIIESRDRSRAGYSAPGCGLYLSGIDYPPDIFI